MACEMSRDDSSSDDDSVSLLCSFDARQTRGAAEDMGGVDLHPAVCSEGQKKELEFKLNSDKAPESGVSSCAGDATDCSNASSKSGTKAMQHVKIPNKALLNKKNGKGETLLHMACKRDDRAQVMALIQAGINVNMEDYAGWTPLHEASARGDPELVKELLKAGANVHARSIDGVTPLHDAVASGHYQVVKLLLQYGSNISDKSLGGLCALDMAKETNIKELLQTSYMCDQSCRAQNSQAESQGYVQLPIQSSFSHSDKANAQSRESGDREGATKAGDIQLKRKDITNANNLSHPKAIKALLEEMRRRQAEIAVWPLAGSGDADRFHAALIQIQNVLIEVLAKQHLEKDKVAQKFRNVPNHFQQHVLKSQIASLASRQRTLVEILLKQIDLVETYINMKAKFSTRPSNSARCTYKRQQPDHFTPVSSNGDKCSYNQDSQGKSQGKVTLSSLLRSAPPNDFKDLKEPITPTQLLTQRRRRTPTAVLSGNFQSSVSHRGNTSQHTNSEMKQKPALTLPRSQDNIRRLSKLLEAGVLAPWSRLQVFWKAQWHVALVQGNGSIKDSKGKLHLAPKHWLESILGNNIPVSSAYAWDKVTYRDKPLSYYLLNMEAAANTQLTCAEDDVPQCRTGCSQEEVLTEAATLKRLLNIRVIHLVNDEELMPVAVLDYHWETVLTRSCCEAEDW